MENRNVLTSIDFLTKSTVVLSIKDKKRRLL